MNRTKVAKELIKMARSIIAGTDFAITFYMSIDIKNFAELLENQERFVSLYSSKSIYEYRFERVVVEKIRSELGKCYQEIAKIIQSKFVNGLRLQGIKADIYCRGGIKVAKKLVKTARSLTGTDFAVTFNMSLDIKNCTEIVNKLKFLGGIAGGAIGGLPGTVIGGILGGVLGILLEKDDVDKKEIEVEIIKKLDLELGKYYQEIAKAIQNKLKERFRAKGIEVEVECRGAKLE